MDWLIRQPEWTEDCLALLNNNLPVSAPNSNITQIKENSENFSLKFVMNNIRLETLSSNVSQEILQRNIDSTYPIIHETPLLLCAEFIIFKRKHGTEIEKNLYGNMNLMDFLQRLLTKKAARFTHSYDKYKLLDGSTGRSNWESIGTKDERTPLILQTCLSYDELKLSAFISISSYSYFINNGARNARGNISENRDEIQSEGIIVSVIGPRACKPLVQESQELTITEEQNTEEKIYPKDNISTLRNIFSKFYEERSYTFHEITDIYNKNNSFGFMLRNFIANKFYNKSFSLKNSNEANRFIKLYDEFFFDNVMYAKRLIISFDTFLLEANQRAKEANKKAYVHFVGIGLGVWKISLHQDSIFVDILAERLSILGAKLSNISDIHLPYYKNLLKFGNCKDGDVMSLPGHPTGIKIHISNRESFSKISDPEKLLIVSYAADSNSLPGNEFWDGYLGSSSDSATASSSQITELHNPHINPLVGANNFRIVTCEGCLIPIQKYFNYVKKSNT